MSDKSNSDEKRSKALTSNELSQFFIGIVLLAVGLYILSTRVEVHSSFYIWRFNSFDISSGIVTIPLIIGVIWCVANPKSFLAKLLTVISSIFLVVSIILSVRLNFISTSLFTYIVIFALIAVGLGLILRISFKK